MFLFLFENTVKTATKFFGRWRREEAVLCGNQAMNTTETRLASLLQNKQCTKILSYLSGRSNVALYISLPILSFLAALITSLSAISKHFQRTIFESRFISGRCEHLKKKRTPFFVSIASS